MGNAISFVSSHMWFMSGIAFLSFPAWLISSYPSRLLKYQILWETFLYFLGKIQVLSTFYAMTVFYTHFYHKYSSRNILNVSFTYLSPPECEHMKSGFYYIHLSVTQSWYSANQHLNANRIIWKMKDFG